MTQYVLPTPPLGKIHRRIYSWCRSQFKKEPIGVVALVITILGLLYSPLKCSYYSFVGPSYGAIVEFKYLPVSTGVQSFFLSVENYSDIPIQAVEATIESSADTLMAQIERQRVVFGSIPPNSVSSKEEISFYAQKPGKGKVIVYLTPYNSQSNVKPKRDEMDFTVSH